MTCCGKVGVWDADGGGDDDDGGHGRWIGSVSEKRSLCLRIRGCGRIFEEEGGNCVVLDIVWGSGACSNVGWGCRWCS